MNSQKYEQGVLTSQRPSYYNAPDKLSTSESFQGHPSTEDGTFSYKQYRTFSASCALPWFQFSFHP